MFSFSACVLALRSSPMRWLLAKSVFCSLLTVDRGRFENCASLVELDLPSDPKIIFVGKRVSGSLWQSVDQFDGSFGQWWWKWVANFVVVLVDALNRNWSWRMLHYICECYVNPLYSYLVILRLLPVIEAMLQELPFQPNNTTQVTRCEIGHYHTMGIFLSWHQLMMVWLFREVYFHTEANTPRQQSTNKNRLTTMTDCQKNYADYSARFAFYGNAPNDTKPDSRNFASYRNASTYASRPLLSW